VYDFKWGGMNGKRVGHAIYEIYQYYMHYKTPKHFIIERYLTKVQNRLDSIGMVMS
jgi:hypothetical protein